MRMQSEIKKYEKTFAGFKKRRNFAAQKGNTRASRAEKRSKNAKIAQLVEHDLAKVGVAGSSPVFRSKNIEIAVD